MVDVVDRATRSRMMSGIRGKNTKPEMVVRRYLHAQGLRYRLHVSRLPGKPDLVFPKYRVALFVHGCFWHRHSGCKYATTPGTRTDFWLRKFAENTERDRLVLEALHGLGWRPLVVWECELKSGAERLALLRSEITGNSSYG
ncbi:MAG: DNA mismatch endonuclease Vsr [Proteobacteria bacterium]|nr:MAG: DNA mismatch endonuclease Vsr [Pseudomonadota bacterium]